MNICMQVCLIQVSRNDGDCKEALALADHMRGNEQVSLTVMRLIPASHGNESIELNINRQKVDMMWRGEKPGDNSINYIDMMVTDGTETSKILHSVAYDYDLFIVGRRSGIGTTITRGLGDWMEFDELGVIGDLLASEYFPSKASVLIIQQQQD